MTANLNWLAFSKRASWSTDLAQAFAALGLSVSPDGAPRRFAGPNFTVEVVIDQRGLDAARLARRHQLEPEAVARYRLAKRWGLAPDAPLTPELLSADDDRHGRPTDRLRLSWLLSCPEALAAIPAHDWLAVERLDPEHGRPFAPDRLRETLAPKVAALQALGVPALLVRFGRGETIAATDPAVLALHATATAHSAAVVAHLRVSPGKLPSGTLRTLLRAVGWVPVGAGRIRTRTGGDRDVRTYSAAPIPLPEGVRWEALIAKWFAELREGGAKTDLTKNPYEDTGFLCWRGPAGQGVSAMVATGGEVIQFLSPIPAHGESGKALRQWLEWWGWKPPARRAAAEAPAPMVT